MLCGAPSSLVEKRRGKCRPVRTGVLAVEVAGHGALRQRAEPLGAVRACAAQRVVPLLAQTQNAGCSTQRAGAGSMPVTNTHGVARGGAGERSPYHVLVGALDLLDFVRRMTVTDLCGAPASRSALDIVPNLYPCLRWCQAGPRGDMH